MSYHKCHPATPKIISRVFSLILFCKNGVPMKNQTLCKDVVCKKKSLMITCECLRVLALLKVR